MLNEEIDPSYNPYYTLPRLARTVKTFNIYEIPHVGDCKLSIGDAVPVPAHSREASGGQKFESHPKTPMNFVVTMGCWNSRTMCMFMNFLTRKARN